jgi:GGDEF domain-containing protein
VARQIEEMVRDRDPSPLSVGERSRLAGFVEGMVAVVAKAAGDRVIATESADRLARAWLIDAGDSELAAACASAQGGGPVVVFHDVGAALDSLDRAPQAAAGAALALALADRPDAVFVAADRKEIDAPAAAARLVAAGIGPLLFVTRDASLTSRLAALAAGATGIVPRLADGASLLRVAREFSPLAPGFTSLAIACPQKELEALAQPLAARGIALQPCLEVEHAVEAIDTQLPALLVVGGASRAMSGPALVRALRTDPTVLELPMVAFVGAQAQADEMLEAGAEDWVSPSMPLEAIARRLEIHARRHLRQLRDLSRDPLTGAVRRPVLVEELDRGLALARRSGRSLGLLLFAFDAAGLAARRGRFALLEAVSGVGVQLRTSFRSSDVVARIEEGRFAVLLQEAGADDARRLLSKQLEALSQRRFGAEPERFAVPFQGGWAGFPEVPGGAQALLDAAEASLLG